MARVACEAWVGTRWVGCPEPHKQTKPMHAKPATLHACVNIVNLPEVGLDSLDEGPRAPDDDGMPSNGLLLDVVDCRIAATSPAICWIDSAERLGLRGADVTGAGRELRLLENHL